MKRVPARRMESTPQDGFAPPGPETGEAGFLAEVLPMLEAMDTAFHHGDARPRHATWSHRDPVTLFGAVMTKQGWADIGPAFDALAARFSDCASFRYEVLASGASGDLGYVVGIEHTTASVGGAPPAPYRLRVTTILRREGGRWKVVHRHGDPMPDPSTAEQLGRMKAGPGRSGRG